VAITIPQSKSNDIGLIYSYVFELKHLKTKAFSAATLKIYLVSLWTNNTNNWGQYDTL